MPSLFRFVFLGSFIFIVSGCSDGALGVRGSPAWYMTASKEAIKKYEANGGTRRKASRSGTSSRSTVYGTSGTSYSSVGNTVFGSDGTTHQRIGSTVFSSDGTTHQRIGNTVFSSDGTTHQRIGNTVFSSDGTTCQTIGSQTFCN